MKQKQIVCALAIIMLLLLSCNLMTGAPISVNTSTPINRNTDTATTDPQVLIDQAVAETMAAQTQIAISVQQTLAAMVTNTPQFTFTPSITLTPESARVSVSVETNCRSGPGTAYGALGALLVGQSAEVVGRSASGDNWIIKLPSNPAITCWVWGQYATVTGNTGNLPIITPPPTPTPTATLPLPPPATNPVLTIVNNGATTIFYAYFSLSTSSSWGDDQLGASTIGSGGSYSWTIVPGTYDIKIEDSAHSVLATWFARDIYGNVTLTYP